jgi:MurNAc alpha-1-phosphate uridylyltransferase
MRGMILAAGRGLRMGEMTQQTPKPLLRVLDRYLIEYAITNLVRAGIGDIIINVSYCAEQIKNALGDGKRFGAAILYSEEKERLETGGGILNALPLLGAEPFVVVSGDVISNFQLQTLPSEPKELAHLIMVDNPRFHPQGDFGIEKGYAKMHTQPVLTFANVGIYRPELFTHCEPGSFRLNQLLFPAIHNSLITAEYFNGLWWNIGTPDQLKECESTLTLSRAREDSNLRPLVSETNTLSN